MISAARPHDFLSSLFWVVIQTGKLQPVFIWCEKPVLLAILSNLTIPVPASYPVFRTKWRKISWVIFVVQIFSQLFFLFLPTKFARTTNMKISCFVPLPKEKKPVCDKQINKYGYLPKINYCTHWHIKSNTWITIVSVYFVLFFVCVYLRLGISSHPKSIAGVPLDSVRRFWATLLQRTTCMCLWCNGVVNCVTA